ncbi:hypothetical protein HAHI6034_05100 [Hathewaya histolytica]|uniref:Uncharacterized protein n=1 Tax=Hathewaya histolytica TaxID=1498 RepID=A0A4U9R863_HATHI|nr:hypothetical protein [Hathewaya histolytica]VTQ86851.1 Uncharacterised protein [Hathewaya histolytica]
MNKKERQAYLQELLNKELEELRVKCFPWKRRDFLLNKVAIEEDYKLDDETSGQYQTIENDKGMTHKITLNPILLTSILNYKWIGQYCLNKRYYKRRLQQTIRHELVHAFVREEWEKLTDIEGVYRDASPIFLATLKFLKGVSHHDACEDFTRKSELYLKVLDMSFENKKYEEFRLEMLKLILEYEKEIRDINVENKNSTKFEFSYRNSGLLGTWNTTTRITGREGKMDINTYNFQIGSRILPGDLKRLTHRKINNGNFELKQEEKYYCFNKDKVVKVWEKKNY